jgi:NAD(P)H dehydrogenase (quinone)
MDLIVFAHPGGESHNLKALDFVKNSLEGNDFEVIDLYKDNFDPVLPTNGYTEENLDSSVKSYQEKVSRCSRMIFLFPIWWYNMPAILKGFFDRVFTSGFAFKFGPAGPEPLFADKSAVVINTFAGPREALKMFGDAPINSLDKSILGFCGMPVKRVNWFNCTEPSDLPDELKKEIEAALKS